LLCLILSMTTILVTLEPTQIITPSAARKSRPPMEANLSLSPSLIAAQTSPAYLVTSTFQGLHLLKWPHWTPAAFSTCNGNGSVKWLQVLQVLLQTSIIILNLICAALFFKFLLEALSQCSLLQRHPLYSSSRLL